MYNHAHGGYYDPNSFISINYLGLVHYRKSSDLPPAVCEAAPKAERGGRKSFETVFNPLRGFAHSTVTALLSTLASESKGVTISLEASMTLRATPGHENMPTYFRSKIDSARRLNVAGIRSCKMPDTGSPLQRLRHTQPRSRDRQHP